MIAKPDFFFIIIKKLVYKFLNFSQKCPRLQEKKSNFNSTEKCFLIYLSQNNLLKLINSIIYIFFMSKLLKNFFCFIICRNSMDLVLAANVFNMIQQLFNNLIRENTSRLTH